jgi:hypothetical protein
MNRRQQIEELRALGLDNLTSEQLDTLNRLVGEEITELRDAELTPEVVADIRTYVGISGEVTGEDDRRAQAEADLQRERDELLAQVDGNGSEGAGEGDGDGAEGAGGSEGDGEGEGEGEGEGAPQAVAASARPRRATLRSTRTPVQPGAAEETGGDLIPIVASADGSRSGPRMTGHAISEALIARIEQIRRSPNAGTDGDKLHVAGATYLDRFGEDRTFSADPGRNTAILDRIAADARGIGTRGDREPVLASGGVCAIYPMDYTYDTIGSQERVVRASLPSGGAPRGGIRFYKPPLYDATVYGQGVRQWTFANDAAVDASDDSTWKPCIEFDCGTDDTAELYAVPQCAEISNLRARFNPENITANLYYLGIAHAALADSLLINFMISKSRYVQENGHEVSALRDLLTYLDVTIATLRDQYRLPLSQAMHIDLPHWAREVLRIDMMKAAFPDDLGGSRFAITDAQIQGWFTARNCAVTWLLDAIDSTQQLTPQAVATIGSPNHLNNLPNVVKFLIYPEGTFTFLDGGELDLGVTRDSSLNRRNRYQLFMETFEGIVMRGVQSQFHAATLTPNGASVGTVAPAAYASTL